MIISKELSRELNFPTAIQLKNIGISVDNRSSKEKLRTFLLKFMSVITRKAKVTSSTVIGLVGGGGVTVEYENQLYSYEIDDIGDLIDFLHSKSYKVVSESDGLVVSWA